MIDPKEQLSVDIKSTRFNVDFVATENLKSALLRKGTMTRRLAISNNPHYMKSKTFRLIGREDLSKISPMLRAQTKFMGRQTANTKG